MGAKWNRTEGDRPVTTMLLTRPTTCPVYGIEAADHFLKYWFRGCEGLAELRYFTNEGPRQEFFALTHLDNMARRAVALSSKGAECYFGVCTRLERKGRKESVAQIPGFFADLDFDRFEAEGIEALERLDAFHPPVTHAIHSGGGMHVYWKLSSPLLPELRTQAMLRAITREIGADPAATDVNRVLRVPGTWSWKRDAPVKLLRCDCES